MPAKRIWNDSHLHAIGMLAKLGKRPVEIFRIMDEHFGMPRYTASSLYYKFFYGKGAREVTPVEGLVKQRGASARSVRGKKQTPVKSVSSLGEARKKLAEMRAEMVAGTAHFYPDEFKLLLKRISKRELAELKGEVSQETESRVFLTGSAKQRTEPKGAAVLNGPVKIRREEVMFLLGLRTALRELLKQERQ